MADRGKQQFSVDVIARLLDLSTRRVQQLSQEGVIPKAGHGRYELVPAVQGYIRYLKAQAINADAVSGDSEHKRRLLKARADIAEMEAERLAGDSVELVAVQRTWVALLAFVRTRLLVLPGELADVTAAESSIEACHDIIETHVHQLLAELAAAAVDGTPEASNGGESVPDGTGAATEDDDLAMGGSLQAIEQ